MMDALVAIATSDFWVSIGGGFHLKLPTLLCSIGIRASVCGVIYIDAH
jgi:hypothetical protein